VGQGFLRDLGYEKAKPKAPSKRFARYQVVIKGETKKLCDLTLAEACEALANTIDVVEKTEKCLSTAAAAIDRWTDNGL
jgi:hypothetical protein